MTDSSREGTDATVEATVQAPASIPPRNHLVGTTLVGRYLITRKIGQGGMGAVYEATHVLIGKRVAVKVLLDKVATTPSIVRRLEQEARLASSIGDDHIIDITDFGETEDGLTFIVMEFLDGESLAQRLGRDRDMSERRICELVVQAAGALAAAHDKGVVHRDIKPENLFVLTREGRDFIKVVDFGISKSLRDGDPRLTETGMVIGTASYMSPEQARGDDDIDARVDVYALGVLLYEAATGRTPFQRANDNYLKVLSQVLSAPVTPPRELRPDLSEAFEAIVLRAIARDRDARFATMAELASALQALIRATPQSMAPTMIAVAPAVVAQAAPAHRSRRRVPHKAIAAAVGVAALAIIAWLIVGGRTASNGSVDFHIESDPSGATVLEGDKILGYTPMTYPFLRENRIIELTAQIPGYDVAHFTINPIADDSGHPIKVRLPMAHP